MIKVSIDPFIHFFSISSLAMRTPVEQLFGETICWMYIFMEELIAIKYVFGGFFMALYRIICLMRPGQKQERQRQITNHLFKMECIIIVSFLGIYLIGAGIAGTNVEMAYCRGIPFEMDQIIQRARGTSQWNIEVGEYFSLAALIFAEMFMGLEMVSVLWGIRVTLSLVRKTHR